MTITIVKGGSLCWYVQAVGDHNYLFGDLCIGWPGSVHDARVLADSSVSQKVTSVVSCSKVKNCKYRDKH